MRARESFFRRVVPVLVLLALPAGVQAQCIFTTLHNFGAIYGDGSAPLTDLVLGSNTLYGTTASGGTNGNGTIFKINTDGSGYGIILSLTNSPSPEGGMVLVGNTLYGTTVHWRVCQQREYFRSEYRRQ